MNLELFGIGNSKKKVAKDSNWRKLESEAERLRELERYKIKTQKTSKRTRERPDVFAINPKNNRDRVIVDAKCTQEVTTANINQVKSYKKTFFAKKAIILTAKDTHVSHEKRKEARDAGIKIKRGKTKRKKGFLDYL